MSAYRDIEKDGTYDDPAFRESTVLWLTQQAPSFQQSGAGQALLNSLSSNLPASLVVQQITQAAQTADRNNTDAAAALTALSSTLLQFQSDTTLYATLTNSVLQNPYTQQLLNGVAAAANLSCDFGNTDQLTNLVKLLTPLESTPALASAVAQIKLSNGNTIQQQILDDINGKTDSAQAIASAFQELYAAFGGSSTTAGYAVYQAAVTYYNAHPVLAPTPLVTPGALGTLGGLPPLGGSLSGPFGANKTDYGIDAVSQAGNTGMGSANLWEDLVNGLPTVPAGGSLVAGESPLISSVASTIRFEAEIPAGAGLAPTATTLPAATTWIIQQLKAAPGDPTSKLTTLGRLLNYFQGTSFYAPLLTAVVGDSYTQQLWKQTLPSSVRSNPEDEANLSIIATLLSPIGKVSPGLADALAHEELIPQTLRLIDNYSIEANSSSDCNLATFWSAVSSIYASVGGNGSKEGITILNAASHGLNSTNHFLQTNTSTGGKEGIVTSRTTTYGMGQAVNQSSADPGFFNDLLNGYTQVNADGTFVTVKSQLQSAVNDVVRRDTGITITTPSVNTSFTMATPEQMANKTQLINTLGAELDLQPIQPTTAKDKAAAAQGTFVSYSLSDAVFGTETLSQLVDKIQSIGGPNATIQALPISFVPEGANASQAQSSSVFKVQSDATGDASFVGPDGTTTGNWLEWVNNDNLGNGTTSYLRGGNYVTNTDGSTQSVYDTHVTANHGPWYSWSNIEMVAGLVAMAVSEVATDGADTPLLIAWLANMSEGILAAESVQGVYQAVESLNKEGWRHWSDWQDYLSLAANTFGGTEALAGIGKRGLILSERLATSGERIENVAQTMGGNKAWDVFTGVADNNFVRVPAIVLNGGQMVLQAGQISLAASQNRPVSFKDVFNLALSGALMGVGIARGARGNNGNSPPTTAEATEGTQQDGLQSAADLALLRTGLNQGLGSVRPIDLELRPEYSSRAQRSGFSPGIQASEDFFVVDSHGFVDPDGFVDSHIESRQGILDFEALATLIESHPSWEKAKIVLLLGCQLAKSDLPQLLSNRLEARVAASDEDVSVGPMSGRIHNQISLKALINRNTRLDHFKIFSPADSNSPLSAPRRQPDNSGAELISSPAATAFSRESRRELLDANLETFLRQQPFLPQRPPFHSVAKISFADELLATDSHRFILDNRFFSQWNGPNLKPIALYFTDPNSASRERAQRLSDILGGYVLSPNVDQPTEWEVLAPNTSAVHSGEIIELSDSDSTFNLVDADGTRHSIQPEGYLGELRGDGGAKTTFQLGKNKVALIYRDRRHSFGDAIESPSAMIYKTNKLQALGAPYVAKIDGAAKIHGQDAIIMDSFLANTKVILHGNWLRNAREFPMVYDTSLFSEKTIESLEATREWMVRERVYIDDLQFLVAKDGTFYVGDPQAVMAGKPPHKSHLDMIDLYLSLASRQVGRQ